MKIKKNDLIMITHSFPKVDWCVVTDVDESNKIVYVEKTNKKYSELKMKSATSEYHITDLMLADYQIHFNESKE